MNFLKKLNYDFVYSYFKDHDCELLESEYISAHTKMKYKCSCGNISYISWSNFKSGYRCFNCGLIKTKEKQKHDFNHIKNEFEKNGCILLSKEYINNNQLLEYICSCGNYSKIRWTSFQYGGRCYKCRNNKISEALKHDYSIICDLFEKNNCKLLTTENEYKSKRFKVKYICSCGNVDYVTPIKFEGNRPHSCGSSMS
jgi:hypothetical protein